MSVLVHCDECCEVVDLDAEPKAVTGMLIRERPGPGMPDGERPAILCFGCRANLEDANRAKD